MPLVVRCTHHAVVETTRPQAAGCLQQPAGLLRLRPPSESACPAAAELRAKGLRNCLSSSASPSSPYIWRGGHNNGIFSSPTTRYRRLPCCFYASVALAQQPKSRLAFLVVSSASSSSAASGRAAPHCAPATAAAIAVSADSSPPQPASRGCLPPFPWLPPLPPPPPSGLLLLPTTLLPMSAKSRMTALTFACETDRRRRERSTAPLTSRGFQKAMRPASGSSAVPRGVAALLLQQRTG